MTTWLFNDNVTGLLAQSASSGATTIIVSTSTGTFPTPISGQQFALAINQSNGATNAENVIVTANSSGTFTLSSGLAHSHVAGEPVALVVVSAFLESITGSSAIIPPYSLAVQTANSTATLNTSSGPVLVTTANNSPTLTLPNAPTVPLTFLFSNIGTGTVTLDASGTDVIQTSGGQVTSTTVAPSSQLTLIYDAGVWVPLSEEGGAEVLSFNTRTGAVTLEAADVEGLFTAADQLFMGTGSGTGELTTTLTAAETIFTAKSQLLVGTGSGTGELLAPGSTGNVLTIGGSDPSGLEWGSGGGSFSTPTTLATLSITAAITLTTSDGPGLFIEPSSSATYDITLPTAPADGTSYFYAVDTSATVVGYHMPVLVAGTGDTLNLNSSLTVSPGTTGWITYRAATKNWMFYNYSGQNYNFDTAGGAEITAVSPTLTNYISQLQVQATSVEWKADILGDNSGPYYFPIIQSDSTGKIWLYPPLRFIVDLVTPTALPANTYNNGSSGVGATLTATSDAGLFVDNVAVATGQRILVMNESTATHNGIYTVTNPGSGTAPYVLTRATDFNQPAQFNNGALVFSTHGYTLAGTIWVLADYDYNSDPMPTPFVIGTSGIQFYPLRQGTPAQVYFYEDNYTDGANHSIWSLLGYSYSHSAYTDWIDIQYNNSYGSSGVAGILLHTSNGGSIIWNNQTITTLSTGGQISTLNDGAGGIIAGSGLGNAVSTITATTTLTDTTAGTILCNPTAAITVTLPSATSYPISSGRIVTIKNISTQTITIATQNSQTIDGASTQTLSTQYSSYTLQSNGTNWFIIAKV